MLNYSTSYAAETDTISVPVLQLPSASLTLVSEGADSVQETLISAPLDRPEMWEFAKKDVVNVYTDNTIPASARPASSRGVQIMVKHTSYTTVTDTADASFQKILPFVSWTCVRIPINELVSAGLAQDEVQRMIGGLYGTTVSSDRIAELIRGALRAQ